MKIYIYDIKYNGWDWECELDMSIKKASELGDIVLKMIQKETQRRKVWNKWTEHWWVVGWLQSV